MNNKIYLYPCIFFVSMATLAYEIALTRIFSIALWHHFAFMVVSIAMLGIACSGTFAAVYPQAKRPERIGRYTLLLSLAIILAYIAVNNLSFDPVKLAWDRKQALYIAVYYLFLGVPFFFSGLIILSAMEHMPEDAGRIYFFDLLGAALGSVAVLFILSGLDEKGAVLAVSFISLAGGFIFSLGEKKGTKIIVIPAAALLIIGIYTYKPSVFEIKISPYKGMMTAMRYPGAEHISTFRGPSSRIDIINSPAIRYAPGLSLKYMDELPPQIGIAIDGGGLNAVTRISGKRDGVRFIDFLPSSLPYAIGKNKSVLIMEPKGGLPVLTALYYGSKDIDRIESNPVIISAVNSALPGFSGNIYKENTFTGLGRAWLKTRGLYDIIDINLTGILPWESGSFGIAEEFRLTREAFIDYYKHLKQDGYLSITLFFLPPARTELRILATINSVMKEMGINDAYRRISVIRSWNTVTILFKNSALQQKEIANIRRFARDRNFDLVYYPGIREEESNTFNKLPNNDYFRLVSGIMDPAGYEKAVEGYLFDIAPVTDERPFFHNFLKVENFFETYRLVGSKWQYFLEEGYLIPIILIQAIALSGLLILLPLFKKGGRAVFSWQVFIYFSGIGLGFMFLEIAIIQRFILYLDHPIYAVTVVIASILLSSGIGSLVSQRFAVDKNWKGGVVMLAAAFGVIYAISLKHIVGATLGWEFSRRLMLSILLLAPMGFFMGMPFPMGIRYLAAAKGSRFIPWAWGVNGAFSVVGSILAAMLALGAGFSGVMFAAGVLYASAFFSIYLSAPRQSWARN